ncbi:MAG: lactonase family protein [Planctomycetia bacterium]|nr:lactonase family protein [Planctomycetia bacterium]
MDTYWIYFGTQTGKTTDAMKDNNVLQSEGIYVGQFHTKTGEITDVRLAAKMITSNFFDFDPERKILYVSGVREKEDGAANVYAYKADPKTGNLNYINYQQTGGKGVCHLSIDKEGKFLVAANYSSGDFTLFRINPDGSIGEKTGFVHKEGGGPDKRRQDSAKGHAAYIVKHQGKTRVFMVDLGSDKVYVQLLDEKSGKIMDDPEIPVLVCPPASGPRHLTWAPDQNGDLAVFVLNELDSTLTVFGLHFGDQNSKGKATTYGTWSTIPDDLRKKLTDEVALVDSKNYFFGSKTAEIELLYKEKPILYASNRGHNSIAVFDVDSFLNGSKKPEAKLTQLQTTFGTFPRFFTSDPTGQYLIVANKRTGTIYTFSIDQKNGKLNIINQDPVRIAWCIAMEFCPIEK